MTVGLKHWSTAIACALLVASAAGAPSMRASSVAPANAALDYWPQWRGPQGVGLSPETSFATTWTPTSNIKWKTEIPGRGHSSPVVWGDRVFLTTSLKGKLVPGRKAPVHLDFNKQPGYLHPDAVDVEYEHTLQVVSVNATTGKVEWTRTAYDGVMFDDRHRKNTYASPTMATDGRLVYAFFESLGVFAYDFAGKLVWTTSLGPIIKAGLGPGTSPVLYGDDLLILLCDQEMGDPSFMVALDRRTGKEVWRTPRSNRRTWATPIIVKVGDHDELITSGAEVVTAYDPRTGQEIWRANGTTSHAIPSPVAGHGLAIFAAGSSGKRALAVRLGQRGDLTNSANVVWRYNKGTAYVPSPILLGDYLYLMTDNGLLTCLDARTGALVYEGGRIPVPATFTASPVAFGDTLLLTSEDGDTFVVKAGPTHSVVRTNSIGEPVFASPALAGATIYLRGERHLFAIAPSATK